MKNARKAIRVCVALASIGALLYGALLMIGHLNRWELAMSPDVAVALAGAAGVLLGITCFQTIDRTLYLRSEGGDPAVR
jgi:hypothetical protein